MKLLLINGPNLNFLGVREPSIYGSSNLKTIELELKKKAENENFKLDTFQSNSEGEIVDVIQKSMNEVNGILINAGAYTHTSIALRDALLTVGIPYIEIHLSNIYSREKFRHNSYIADNALGIISGFGAMSYFLALTGIISYLRDQPNH